MATVLGLEGAVAYLHAFVFNVSGLPEVPYVLQFFFSLKRYLFERWRKRGKKRDPSSTDSPLQCFTIARAG